MKQKKMTKRQILNELLAVREKQLKLHESEKRLHARQQKERERRNQLAKELASSLWAEAKKKKLEDFDVEENPIFFKEHVFELETGVGYDNRTEIEITPTKSVK